MSWVYIPSGQRYIYLACSHYGRNTLLRRTVIAVGCKAVQKDGLPGHGDSALGETGLTRETLQTTTRSFRSDCDRLAGRADVERWHSNQDKLEREIAGRI